MSAHAPSLRPGDRGHHELHASHNPPPRHIEKEKENKSRARSDCALAAELSESGLHVFAIVLSLAFFSQNPRYTMKSFNLLAFLCMLFVAASAAVPSLRLRRSRRGTGQDGGVHHRLTWRAEVRCARQAAPRSSRDAARAIPSYQRLAAAHSALV